MKRTGFIAILVMSFALAAFGQPRPMEKTAPEVKPAPASFAAKYEGGLFGFTDKVVGTLRFDDENERIVFIGKDEKEMFAIPYESLLIVSPQTNSVTSVPGTVVSNVPLPGAGIAGQLMKEKKQYLLLQFDDPDVEAKGTVNFKIEGKELLDSVVHTLGRKAKLSPRGDSYYRPRPKTSSI